MFKQVLQVALLLPREKGQSASIVLALIGKGLWSILVVTTCQNPNPVGTIPGHLGDFAHALAPSQQPDDLKVAAFDRISCFPITPSQVIRTEMSSDTNIFRHSFLFLSENNTSRGNSFRLQASKKTASGLIILYSELV